MSPFLGLLGSCCLGANRSITASHQYTTRDDSYLPYRDKPSNTDVANDIVAKLFAAKKNDAALQADLRSTYHTYGWYDGLAAAILTGIETAIEEGKKMGPVLEAAYDKAVAAVKSIKD